MYDCRRVDRALRRGTSIDDAWRLGIFGIWAMSEQVRPVLEYVAASLETPRPIETAGMDSQLTGSGTAEELRTHLRSLLDRARPPALDPEETDVLLSCVGRLGDHTATFDDEESHRFRAAVDTLLEHLADDAGPFAVTTASFERSLLHRAVRNAAAWQRMRQLQGGGRTSQQDQLRVALAREPAMADTLVWLANACYPDRRLIVWAASSHVMHNSRSVEMAGPNGTWTYDVDPWEPMGNRVREQLGTSIYTIGFIAYEGVAGTVFGRRWPVQAAPVGSLDALCHETGLDALFVDLRTMPDRPGGAVAPRTARRPPSRVRADASRLVRRLRRHGVHRPHGAERAIRAGGRRREMTAARYNDAFPSQHEADDAS